jgi:beta-galactosidase/beta-glucuronidase
VWVNGKRVGYFTDSRLPSEFDIPDALTPDGLFLFLFYLFLFLIILLI